jgi:hypothetical protein
MDKKFLNKVVEHLKSETKFESRKDGLYWSYPFNSKLTILKPYFANNKDSQFCKHCRNVYGLKNEEIRYVMGKYIEWLSLSLDLPIDTIYFPNPSRS